MKFHSTIEKVILLLKKKNNDPRTKMEIIFININNYKLLVDNGLKSNVFISPMTIGSKILISILTEIPQSQTK